MAIEEVTKRLRIESTTSQVEKAAADINKVAAAEANLAVQSEKAERSQLSLDNAFAKLERRYVDGVRQQQEFANVQRSINAAVAQNPALQERSNVVLAAARERLIGVSVANDNVAKSTGLARHEMINFSRQVQDIGVSLASGQSPFTVLLQQGAQVADIFATSQGSVRGFFAQMTAGAGRFATSAVGVTAALVGIGATAAGAALSWVSAQKDVEKALLGVGRASKTTVADVERIAQASSSAFGLSTSEAREFATALAATGKISAEVNSAVTGMGKDIARVFGNDIAQAQKAMAQAFADPARGVDALNERLGSFDAGLRRNIINLQAQNKTIEAQNLLVEGTKRGLAGVPEAIGKVESAWTAVANAASNAWNATGRFIARQTGIAPRDLGAEAKKLEDEIARLEAGGRVTRLGLSARSGAGAENVALTRAQEELRKVQEEIRKTTEAAEDAARRIQSVRFEEAVRGQLPEVAQIEALRNQAELLADAIAKINRSGGAQESPMLASLGMTMQQVQLAAARSREALDSALGPAEKLTAEFQLQVAQITARSGAERAAVAARQTELQLAGQNVSAEEKALAVSRARYLVLLQIAVTHRNAMAALGDQVRVSAAVTGQEKLRAQEIATTNALMREGFSMQQAADQAAMQRLATQKQIDASIQSQVIAIQSQIQYMRDVQEYGEGAAEAAKAYRDAITQGASQTAAAALAAATLERNMEQAQIAAERLADRLQTAAGAAGSLGQGLGAKLDKIGTGVGGSFQAGTGFAKPGDVVHSQGAGGGPLVGAGGMSTPLSKPIISPYFQDILDLQQNFQQNLYQQQQQSIQQQQSDYQARIKAEIAKTTPGTDAYIQAQQQLADAANQAAQALQDAAEAAAKLADETFTENVAAAILSGSSPRDINQLIESGMLYAGTASQRFETQLDLYRRAGMTNEQILADIRGGVIGEGVKATELLRAIDDLTGAVESNTGALSSLSPFYTQQGDRLLGYRGYEVQKRLGGASLGGIGGTTYIGGVPGSAGGTTGGMGGVVNTLPGINYPTSSGGAAGTTSIPGVPAGYIEYPYSYVPGITLPSNFIFVNGKYYYKPNTGTLPTGTGQMPVTNSYPNVQTFGMTSPYPNKISQLYGQPYTFAEGGIVNGPTSAIIGEAGPEAVIPLSPGYGRGIKDALTRLGANPTPPWLQQLLTTLVAAMAEKPERAGVEINAPLIYFQSEPTRDEVRETGYQTMELLRRSLGRPH
jgi:phage-related minor tail protein